MTSKTRTCTVCDAALAAGEGEPCVLCGRWFHYAPQRQDGRLCGVYSDTVPGLGACGALFVCAPCARESGVPLPTAASSP